MLHFYSTMNVEAIQIQISVDSLEEANRLANFLLSSKLAASVQQIKSSTQYLWEGKIEEAEEYIILIQTLASKFKEIESEIKKRHTYEVPEIIALPIEKISKDYYNWIVRSLRKNLDQKNQP